MLPIQCLRNIILRIYFLTECTQGIQKHLVVVCSVYTCCKQIKLQGDLFTRSFLLLATKTFQSM